MNGFLFALLAAFLWSIVNIIDKYLVEKFCKDSGVGALIVLSSLFPITLLPIAWFFAEGSLSIGILSTGILLLSGMLAVVWIALYLFALEEEDVSVVMPLFQLTPLFALLFGFVLLSELPTSFQLIAGAIILVGSLVLSIEHTTGKIKWRLVGYLSGASAAIALMFALFKFVAVNEFYWISIFWHSIGIVIAGTLLYGLYSPYRHQFHSFLKQNAGIGLTLNGINESLTLIGDLLFAYAILLAPLAIIQTVEAFQPAFVFLIGGALTLFAPKIIKEDLSRAILVQKIVGITLVVLGTLLLHF